MNLMNSFKMLGCRIHSICLKQNSDCELENVKALNFCSFYFQILRTLDSLTIAAICQVHATFQFLNLNLARDIISTTESTPCNIIVSKIF